MYNLEIQCATEIDRACSHTLTLGLSLLYTGPSCIISELGQGTYIAMTSLLHDCMYIRELCQG